MYVHNVHIALTVYSLNADKPKIETCTLVHDGYAVNITYNPFKSPQNDEYHHIEFIEVGLRDGERWVPLDHEEGYNYEKKKHLMILPPSRSPVKRLLQVLVKYKRCPIRIYSEAYEVEQPAICKQVM